MSTAAAHATAADYLQRMIDEGYRLDEDMLRLWAEHWGITEVRARAMYAAAEEKRKGKKP